MNVKITMPLVVSKSHALFPALELIAELHEGVRALNFRS